MHFHGGADALGGNILVAGRVVNRDGEDQRSAVVHFDQLLLGRSAVRTLADSVATLVVSDGGGKDFRRTGGAIADQHGDRLGPDNFRWIGGRNDGRNGLAFQRGDRARRKKQLRGLDSFLVIADRESISSRRCVGTEPASRESAWTFQR